MHLSSRLINSTMTSLTKTCGSNYIPRLLWGKKKVIHFELPSSLHSTYAVRLHNSVTSMANVATGCGAMPHQHYESIKKKIGAFCIHFPHPFAWNGFCRANRFVFLAAFKNGHKRFPFNNSLHNSQQNFATAWSNAGACILRIKQKPLSG